MTNDQKIVQTRMIELKALAQRRLHSFHVLVDCRGIRYNRCIRELRSPYVATAAAKLRRLRPGHLGPRNLRVNVPPG